MTEPAVEALYAFFQDLDIAVIEHRHPPLHTVAESQALRGELPGAHVKNMFLKDKKGGLWLVTCLEDRVFKIRDLERALGAPRMSFGKPELLWDVLGVRPGAVTPLAIFNDRAAQAVSLVLDQRMMSDAVLNCHPLHNEATVAIGRADFERFVAACGHRPSLVDFDAFATLEA